MAVQYQPSGPSSRWEWGCTISQKPYESIYHLRSFPGIHTKYSDFYLIGQHLLTSLYKRGYEIHFSWLHCSPQDNQGSAGRKKKKNERGYWAGTQQIWPQPPYKESSYNARDPSSIPGSGRSAGEGIGYPLQSSWAFPCGSAGKESAHNAGDQGLILGWEDPLEKGKATLSSILAWRIPWTVWSMGPQRVGHLWVTFTFSYNCLFIWYMYIMLQFYG